MESINGMLLFLGASGTGFWPALVKLTLVGGASVVAFLLLTAGYEILRVLLRWSARAAKAVWVTARLRRTPTRADVLSALGAAFDGAKVEDTGCFPRAKRQAWDVRIATTPRREIRVSEEWLAYAFAKRLSRAELERHFRLLKYSQSWAPLPDGTLGYWLR